MLSPIGSPVGSDAEASGSDSDYEEMFDGWSLEDHIKEMASLHREFTRIKGEQYEEVCERIEARTKAINMGSDPEWKVQDTAMKKVQDAQKHKFDTMKASRESGADALVDLAKQMHTTTLVDGEASIKARMLEKLQHRRILAGKDARKPEWIPPHLNKEWKVPYVPAPDDDPAGFGATLDRSAEMIADRIKREHGSVAGTGLTITDTLRRAGYDGWSEPEDEDDYQSRQPFDPQAYFNAKAMQHQQSLATPHSGLPPMPMGVPLIGVQGNAAAAAVAAAAAAAATAAGDMSGRHPNGMPIAVPLRTVPAAGTRPASFDYAAYYSSKRVTVKPFVYGLDPKEIDQDLNAFGL